MANTPEKLKNYFHRIAGILPESMISVESTRLLILFFGTLGLDLISSLSQEDAHEIIEWVYCHQIKSDNDNDKHCGFRGSSYLCRSNEHQTQSPYDCSHVTMVYNALCILITLGDDLSQVDRRGVLHGITALHCEDDPGLFQANLISPERDMRFVYSAVASCFILDGLDVLDKEAILSFIDRSYTYEGGFAQLPGLEAHAGATYCALASLTLLDSVSILFPVGSRRRDRLIKWLISLQCKGFHGRMHKPDDTCYTFWVCASLRLLGCESLVNQTELLQFVSSAWDELLGGIRKYPDPSYPPDPLHTYLCLSGVACLKATPDLHLASISTPNGDHDPEKNQDDAKRFESFRLLFTQNLRPIRPELNITEPVYLHLKELHRKWRSLPDKSSTINPNPIPRQ